MADPDKPLQSIELDADKAIERNKHLEATNHYLCRRYNGLHTAYRRQEQEHDQAKTLIAQGTQQIAALEEAVKRLKDENEAIASNKRMTDEEFRRWEERSKLADKVAWEVLPGWMEARGMRLREKSRQEMRRYEHEQRLEGENSRKRKRDVSETS